jgi:hypothetical protein
MDSTNRTGTNAGPFALFHQSRLSNTHPMATDRAPAGYKSRPGTAQLDLTRRIPAMVVRKPAAPQRSKPRDSAYTPRTRQVEGVDQR